VIEMQDEENKRGWSSHRQAPPKPLLERMKRTSQVATITRCVDLVQHAGPFQKYRDGPLDGLTYRPKSPQRGLAGPTNPGPRSADFPGSRVRSGLDDGDRQRCRVGTCFQRPPHLAALSSALLPFSSPPKLQLLSPQPPAPTTAAPTKAPTAQVSKFIFFPPDSSPSASRLEFGVYLVGGYECGTVQGDLCGTEWLE